MIHDLSGIETLKDDYHPDDDPRPSNEERSDSGQEDPRIEIAFMKFREAWFLGKNPDPDVFMQKHRNLGGKLERKISDFLFVVNKISGALKDVKEDPDISLLSEKCAGRQFGDFRIIRQIGHGGMGIVYEAEQISLKRKVALKLLSLHLVYSDKAVLKFKREAEAGGRQHHPGIVEVYTIGTQDGIHYIAQELVEGGKNLQEYLGEIRIEGRMPSDYYQDGAKLIRAAARALGYAHQSGVIHRDIKPSNIMITRDGLPKITDFGLAKVEDAVSLSRTGEWAGTPNYMSPEQTKGSRQGTDKRTDIFSLGVTLYELLTLKLPFEGKTPYEVLKKIQLDDPVSPEKVNENVPRDLAVICMKALEKSPDKRYQSMEDLAEDLERYLRGDVILAATPSVGTWVWKRVKRYPIVSATVSIAFLSLLSLIGYMLWSYYKINEANDRLENQRKIAVENYNGVIRLSDMLRVSELKTDAESLWPAYPVNRKKYEKWITQCKEVVSRLDIHIQTLSQIEKRALPKTGKEEQGSDIFTFPDKETQWQYNCLSTLVSDLQSITDPREGLLHDVMRRLSFATTIRQKSVDDFEVEWGEAVRSIANRDESPKYNGLVITSQIGFVPIGKDYQSGLWEFWDMQTGERPERGEDGKLSMTEESGMIFVLIPGGVYKMGSFPPSEDHHIGMPNVFVSSESDEAPVHEVAVSPFFLSKYEIAQSQWLRFTGKNPSYYTNKFDYEGRKISLLHPVENVSWEDCNRVVNQMGFRLPSEAEWEYAARAGTTTPWWTGETAETLQGALNCADLYCKKHNPVDWPCDDFLDDGYLLHAPVDAFTANPFGLYNVYGNVWEWCQDTYNSDESHQYLCYNGAPTDGSAWIVERITQRVKRGGSYGYQSAYCRSAFRGHDDQAGYKDFELGCRPARSVTSD